MAEKVQVGAPIPLTLKAVRKEAHGTYSYIFPIPDQFTWDEGCFVHLGNSQFDPAKGRENREFVRHLSIASLSDEGELRFTTRIPENRSAYKAALAAANPGDTFMLFKPANRMELRREGRPVVLISAGVAMATTRPMMRAFALDSSGIPSLIHLNIDSSADFLYRREVEQWVEDTPGLANHYADSRVYLYAKLEETFLPDAIYYVVGSDGFLVSVGTWLVERGIDKSAIMLDKNQPFYDRISE
ncbi:hypothetical protein EGM51_08440 [Verrucomicrobia bacterium S94]|nr:hypothetical protein EGM51_08440 [Verrucomicrobia bacterium S94]